MKKKKKQQHNNKEINKYNNKLHELCKYPITDGLKNITVH